MKIEFGGLLYSNKEYVNLGVNKKHIIHFYIIFSLVKGEMYMKKIYKSIFKVMSFLLVWSLTVVLPIEICEKPGFVGNSPALLRLYYEIVPLIMTIIVTIFYTRLVDKKNKLSILFTQNIIFDTVLGLALGILWIGSVLFISIKMGILRFEDYKYIPYLYIWIIAIFINVIMQELLVRGYMFSILKKEFNSIVAVICTSLIFTMLHGGAFEVGVVAVMNVFSTSILLSIVLIYSKGLWLPILMHFSWNTIGRLFGIVSLADDYPSMFNVKISGTNLLAGGDVGLEGSIIVLIINIIMILTLLYCLKYKNKKVKHSSLININI